MSLPEAQPEYSHNSKADSYTRLDTLMLVHNMDKLQAVAKKCGALSVTGVKEYQIDVDVNLNDVHSVNPLNRPVVCFESANFYISQQDSVLAYQVKHHTESAVAGSDRQSLSRDYWLYYVLPDEKLSAIYDPKTSRHCISLEMIGPSESVRLMRNEGAPLQPEEQIQFDKAVTDFGSINGHQFREIEDLIIRAVNSLQSS